MINRHLYTIDKLVVPEKGLTSVPLHLATVFDGQYIFCVELQFVYLPLLQETKTATPTCSPTGFFQI
jgi:hypothetical protein